jgi:hypothetical protein
MINKIAKEFGIAPETLEGALGWWMLTKPARLPAPLSGSKNLELLLRVLAKQELNKAHTR